MLHVKVKPRIIAHEAKPCVAATCVSPLASLVVELKLAGFLLVFALCRPPRLS